MPQVAGVLGHDRLAGPRLGRGWLLPPAAPGALPGLLLTLGLGMTEGLALGVTEGLTLGLGLLLGVALGLLRAGLGLNDVGGGGGGIGMGTSAARSGWWWWWRRWCTGGALLLRVGVGMVTLGDAALRMGGGWRIVSVTVWAPKNKAAATTRTPPTSTPFCVRRCT